MKPFNLERALAGDPVITRDGREVAQIHLFKGLNGLNKRFPIRAVIKGDVVSFTPEGCYYDGGDQHELDLFMAPKEQKFYVASFVSERGGAGSHIFSEERDALDFAEARRCNFPSGSVIIIPVTHIL